MVMDKAGFKTTVEDRYFEDYVPRSVHEFGRITIEEASFLLASSLTLSYFTPIQKEPNQRYTVAS